MLKGSSPSCLIDLAAPLVVDASTVINLNASGCARRILEPLPNCVLVIDIVADELQRGRQRQRRDGDLLLEMATNKIVEIVSLDVTGVDYFEELVIGDAQNTLDDGEAATIAHALSLNGIAVFDESKATRICAERFPNLRLACSVDIFSHPSVLEALGDSALADAIFGALYHGRMRVFPHHVDWVVARIGLERAEQCLSLPRKARGVRHCQDGTNR